MQRRMMPVEELAALSNDLQASVVRWRQTRSPDDMRKINYDRGRIQMLCMSEGMYLPDCFYTTDKDKLSLA